MIKILISFLLISLNVLYAFESHSKEAPISHGTDFSITAEFHHDGPCSEGNHSGEAPTDEHACHLGHCSFVVSTFLLAFKAPVDYQVFSYLTGVVSPFIDEEIRPQIFS